MKRRGAVLLFPLNKYPVVVHRLRRSCSAARPERKILPRCVNIKFPIGRTHSQV